MEHRLLDALADVLPEALGRQLVVAYSGGRDSTALLHALRQLASPTWRLTALHVNHQLQPQAAQWAEHCVRQCQAWGVPCEVRTVEVDRSGGLGLEAAAREARYAALRQAISADTVLVTAHHQGDQMETLLLQLLRGAGVQGLAAMPVSRRFGEGVHLRPLLGVPPQQIVDYARQHGLQWIDDPSNRDSRYDRNYLRHQIVPSFLSRWPGAAQTISRSAQHCAETAALLDQFLQHDLATVRLDHARLDLAPLRRFDPLRAKQVLRHWLQTEGGLVPSAEQLAQLARQFLEAKPDRSPLFTFGKIELRRHRDTLYRLPPLPPFDAAQVIPWDGVAPVTVLGVGTVSCAISHGDGVSHRALQAAKRIELRFRQGGERVALPGRGRHTLKKLLQDAQVPPWQRERIPLLYLDGELAAVVGHFVCEPFAAAPDQAGVRHFVL